MNYERNEYEAKVHLKIPFLFVLKKWRSLLIIMVILAIIFGAYTVIVAKINVNSSKVKELNNLISEKEERVSYLNKAVSKKEKDISMWSETKNQLDLRLNEISKIELSSAEDLSNLIELKDEVNDIVNDINTAIESKNSYNNEATNLKNEISVLQSDIERKTVLSFRIVIFKAIAGAIAGAIIFFIVAFLKIIFDGRFHCREDFEDGMGLYILGWIYTPYRLKKENKFDKYIYKLESCIQVKDDFKMITARLETGLSNEIDTEVILTGPVEENKLINVKEKICDNLKNNLNVKIIENPIRNCDNLYEIGRKSVVIVAENNKTKVSELNNLINSLYHGNSQIAGCIIV